MEARVSLCRFLSLSGGYLVWGAFRPTTPLTSHWIFIHKAFSSIKLLLFLCQKCQKCPVAWFSCLIQPLLLVLPLSKHQFLFFIKFGEFSAVISLTIPLSSCLSSCSGILIMHAFYDQWCPRGLLVSVHFSSFFFPSALQTGSYQSTYFHVCGFFLLPAQICQ